MGVLQELRLGWLALAAAVLPVECAGCGRPDVGLCAPCAGTLTGPAGPVGNLTAAGCPPVAAVAAYGGRPRGVLIAWKDRGRHDLAPVLADALAAAVCAVAAQQVGRGTPLALVPVPSAGRAVRRRGEDVVAGLARGAASRLRAAGLEVAVVPVLRQARRVHDQAELGAAQRAGNLAGAHRVPWPRLVRGRTCLVVDDVVTTGATLAESTRALRRAGAVVPGAAVVAATPRRRSTGGPLPRVSGASGVD